MSRDSLQGLIKNIFHSVWINALKRLNCPFYTVSLWVLWETVLFRFYQIICRNSLILESRNEGNNVAQRHIKEERQFTPHMCHCSRYRIKASTSSSRFAQGSTKSSPCFIYDPWASSCMRTVNSLLLQHSCLSACTQDFMPAQDLKVHRHGLDTNIVYSVHGLCSSESLKYHIFPDKNVRLSIVILSPTRGVTNSLTLAEGSKQIFIILVTVT